MLMEKTVTMMKMPSMVEVRKGTVLQPTLTDEAPIQLFLSILSFLFSVFLKSFLFSDVSLKKKCCKQQTPVSTWLQFGIQCRLARLAESRKLWMGQRREERGILWEEGEREEETRRSTESAPLFSAGSSWWTESEESGHGSQTRDNTCTLHHGSHTPWWTGGRGIRGTGSTQSYKYKRKNYIYLIHIIKSQKSDLQSWFSSASCAIQLCKITPEQQCWERGLETFTVVDIFKA